jgi:hypothetical protein
MGIVGQPLRLAESNPRLRKRSEPYKRIADVGSWAKQKLRLKDLVFCRSFQGNQLLRLFGVAFLESLNTARGVHVLLGAGKVRVTLGADADAHVLVRGACFEDAAARAVDDGFDVLRMYLGFHSVKAAKGSGIGQGMQDEFWSIFGCLAGRCLTGL